MPGVNDIVWQALATHRQKIERTSLVELFEQDPERVERYRLDAAGLTLDYSKNLITDETLNLFSRLIDANSLPHRVQQMIEGERINVTERRAALHTLLRTRPNKLPETVLTEGQAVAETLARVEEISADIRAKRWTGTGDTPITDVLHIGIGGSFLGPQTVHAALEPGRRASVNVHFVANVDGHHIDSVIKRLDPKSTLIIIASKTFTTQETMLNAQTARDWLRTRIADEELHRHLVAVSANTERATAFGVAAENVLPMWDWVGGRFSLWSAVGLPIAIAYGFRTFRNLLDGAAAMDVHFEEAPWPENMPMMLALLGIWYINFFDAHTQAVVPYDHGLRLLPMHLQQLDMESNGKSVNTQGRAIAYATGPIVWGGEGTNGQHAFHQLLHQGKRFVPIDFLLPLRPHHNRQEHHDWLVANCLAQSRALMTGQPAPKADRTAAHRGLPGNRPSNLIVMDKLTPETLGATIALYEHKVFCQAMIWHINPFDQFGVELGKAIGKSIMGAITDDEDAAVDPSTQALIDLYKSKR